MGFGASLTFIAIGAILAFAVKWDVPGIDLQLIGWIFMGVGVAGGVITRLYTRRPGEDETIEVIEPDVLYTADPAPEHHAHAHSTAPHAHTTAPHVHAHGTDPRHARDGDTRAVHRVSHVDDPHRAPEDPTRPQFRDGPV
ncbi:hypothetical protein HNP84_001604 [Thermocatellispora tengchongensis]|uniref:DUF6458 domain-containing protein n=1 Tax=Thermocatellispora tengchongensis TaxID=1073253 RepID=A0A840P1X2_9ACTN|nr:DUF6458 family protein [Thermocatellispora tengchongensis]MBB5131891.1 hypothetical protein [Thermocatellispora tengchongensis]